MKKYVSETSFLQALGDHLKKYELETGIPAERIRRQIAFDRLLARFFSRKNTPWILKGGYALELRIKNARATRDIDMALRDHRLRSQNRNEQRETLTNMLMEIAKMDLKDYFTFDIDRPLANLEGPPHGGVRYLVTSSSAGRMFSRFHLDISVGEEVLEPVEQLPGKSWLEFAKIPQTPYLIVTKEQHFSEKIHAYTRPREGSNSRVKDLLDLVLLIQSGLDKERTRRALEFSFRQNPSHDIPEELPAPPPFWNAPLERMASEAGLDLKLETAFEIVSQFYNQLLKI